ncbi:MULTISPECIES: hypothetical protein [Shewanella]|jgi:hypothetical protein|nr:MULTISPECIES: hypothetical protein [Shewanella]
MSKGQNAKKDTKKQPLLSAKEKRAAKQAKKNPQVFLEKAKK